MIKRDDEQHKVMFLNTLKKFNGRSNHDNIKPQSEMVHFTTNTLYLQERMMVPSSYNCPNRFRVSRISRLGFTRKNVEKYLGVVRMNSNQI